MKFKGTWASLIIPWNADYTIDTSALSDEINILIEARVDGIYSGGTAGEFHLLNEAEFYTINSILSSQCRKNNMPFQIGASHQNPNESINKINIAMDFHPDGIQLIAPDWWKASTKITIEFLNKASEVTEGKFPLILYNPPHAKKVYTPLELIEIKTAVSMLKGIKVNDGDNQWYRQMEMLLFDKDFSVFIPGHHLASGVKKGASGSYSNVCCLNPFAAQKWSNQIQQKEWETVIELEKRINEFMDIVIKPYLNYIPNYLIDRAMALAGQWSQITEICKWPYSGLQHEDIELIRKKGSNIIPEFFNI